MTFNIQTPGKNIILYNNDGLIIDDIEISQLQNNSLIYLSTNSNNSYKQY